MMETNHEKPEMCYFSIPEPLAQGLFLALCDAMERLDFKGASQSYRCLHWLANYVLPDGVGPDDIRASFDRVQQGLGIERRAEHDYDIIMAQMER